MELLDLKFRMYFLVMYNLSPEQKGIQSAHALAEYQLLFGQTPEYLTWAKRDKTIYMMNGGTSNTGGHNFYTGLQETGSMEQYIEKLVNNNIKVAAFNEPDLNNSTSAIAFLVDESAFNLEKYPDPPDNTSNSVHYSDISLFYAKRKENRYKMLVDAYGERTAFLREFIRPLKFA